MPLESHDMADKTAESVCSADPLAFVKAVLAEALTLYVATVPAGDWPALARTLHAIGGRWIGVALLGDDGRVAGIVVLSEFRPPVADVEAIEPERFAGYWTGMLSAMLADRMVASPHWSQREGDGR